MSIALELAQRGRKTGRVCSRDYRSGTNCPLIVRSTSEDLFTANVFGTLKHLNPELWLLPIARRAVPDWQPTADPAVVTLWSRAEVPLERAGFEGQSEVDVLIRWGRLTLFVEVKYRAPLARRTANDASRDQFGRMLDVAECLETRMTLFPSSPAVILVGLSRWAPKAVWRYQRFRRVPHGYVSWREIQQWLVEAESQTSGVEQSLFKELAEYVELKVLQCRS